MSDFIEHPPENSNDLSRASLTAQYLASDGLMNFQEQNTEGEYRLWLMNLPQDVPLEQASEKRTRRFERAVHFDRARIAVGYGVGGLIAGLVAVDDSIPLFTKPFVAGFLSAPFLLGARSQHGQLPTTIQDAQQQRLFHNQFFNNPQ